MKTRYYIFYLEIALKDPDDPRIYAFKNVSAIPTKMLIEIFGVNLKKDPYLSEGYFLTKTRYRKHKKYIQKNIGSINLDVFEYCLRVYVADGFDRIRRYYKKSLME